jgi:hypothetical protein
MMGLETGGLMKFRTAESAAATVRPFYAGLVLAVLLIALGRADAMGAEIGLRAGFKDGPMVSVVGSAELNERLSLNVPVGGLPGIIMRVESNLRMSVGSLERNWPRYVEGGIGYWEIFRGSGDGKNVKEIHFSYGMTRRYWSDFEITASIGLLYAPHFANPWFKEEDMADLPIVPMIGLEATYWIW